MAFHYLDNAATTRVLLPAAEAAFAAMREHFGNPSSLYRLGLDAKKLLASAREQAAAAMGCLPEELFFTSGGTEGIATALAGAAARRKSRRHIVSTEIEHAAVLNTLKRLSEDGFDCTLVPPERDGTVAAEKVLAAVRDDTALVSVMAVNNETGAVLPVEEIGRELRRKDPRVLFHADAIQAFFKRETPPARLPADLVTVSGHKIGAPKGVGALYIRKGVTLPPLFYGGGQESGMRAGTEPMPGIAAFAAACAVRRENLQADLAKIAGLRGLLRGKLAKELPEAVMISPDGGAPHILCFALPGAKSEVVIRALSDREVYVSGGSACSRGKKSHVLTAMKLPPAVAEGAIRVSFCPENNESDVAALMDGLLAARDMFR